MDLFSKENGNVVVPLALFLVFFIFKAFAQMSEFWLTIIALLFCALIFKVQIHKNEYKVFLLGLLIGSFIEIVLGLISRKQFWDDASLFGIPFWLPIAWAIGFVIITRVGMTIEGFKWEENK
ncbi:MAG: hypothetical protein ACYC1K_00960 [Minisyncoccota bacterium]